VASAIFIAALVLLSASNGALLLERPPIERVDPAHASPAARCALDWFCKQELLVYYELGEILRGSEVVVGPDTPIRRRRWRNIALTTIRDRGFSARLGGDAHAFLSGQVTATLASRQRDASERSVFQVVGDPAGLRGSVVQLLPDDRPRAFFLVPQSVAVSVSEKLR
jgi:hypothetical protein